MRSYYKHTTRESRQNELIIIIIITNNPALLTICSFLSETRSISEAKANVTIKQYRTQI